MSDLQTGCLLVFAGGICHALSWYMGYKIYAAVLSSGGVKTPKARNVPTTVVREYRSRYPASRLPRFMLLLASVGAVFYVTGFFVMSGFFA
jgi:hypothetical protein